MLMDFEARQAAIKDLLTCPICKKLCRKVTIIEECCHRCEASNCKKCITRKITQENIRCCPVCNLDLGCAPLQKLSPDNRWQSFRNKFSEKRNQLIERGLIKGKARKREAEVEAKVPEVLPSAARQKERPLSSVAREPEVSNQTSMPGRRKRGGRKHPPQRASFPSMSSSGKEGDYPESSKEGVEQRFVAEQINQEMPYTGEEHGSKSQLEEMNLLLNPLNDMLQDVAITKSSNNCPVATSAPSGIRGNEAAKSRLKLKGLAHNSKFLNDGKCHARSDSLRLGKMHHQRQENAPVSEGFSLPAQSVVDATSSRCRERENPVWFSLIASEQQEGRAPLPQIHPCYLRVKDANLPVSYIKKYLVRKLDLNSEDEVDISLHGQPLFPGWRLHEVMELWLRTMPKHRRTTFVGNSAEDFMMVLSYASRPHQPA